MTSHFGHSMHTTATLDHAHSMQENNGKSPLIIISMLLGWYRRTLNVTDKVI